MLAQLILLVLSLLILIGDAVRLCAKFCYSIIRAPFAITVFLYPLIKQALFSWLAEKRDLSYKLINTIVAKSPLNKISHKNIPHAKNILSPISKTKENSIGLTTRLHHFFNLFYIPHHTPKTNSSTIKITDSPNFPRFTISLTPLVKFQIFLMGFIFATTVLIVPFISYSWLTSLPNPQLLTTRSIEATTQILDRNGSLLYEVYAEQNRTPILLTDLPPYVTQATIAIEDKNFYNHNGFSISGIIRASKETVFDGTVQGGSTITQQLIKSALLTSEVKITRKIKELVLAFWAERIYTKNEILEMYLNQVPYGGTAWGIEAAANTYFGKSAKSLTLAEAALLAGLPQAPSDYSPFGAHPDRAKMRQLAVLNRMVEDGYITEEEGTSAAKAPIAFVSQNVTIRAPHFVMYVKKLLEDELGTRLVERGGLRIRTSLDLSLQEEAEDIVQTQINKLTSLQVSNGAALVTNPKNGEILAMVGSKNYFDSKSDGNVNVTTSLRQPGSSIKPVTYALALSDKFTTASLIDDSPVTYTSNGSVAYSPVNYDGKYHGMVPLRYALANSYNIPAVKLIQTLGVAKVVSLGKLMGIQNWEDSSRFGLSLTLGGGEVTMLDMASVYGTLANGGIYTPLKPILEITDYKGRIYKMPSIKTAQEILKPEVAWIISHILSDNTARIPAFGPNSQLVIPEKTVSVKTGTTNEKRDNWTIGYTPSFVTTVWVGNNDNSPMNQQLTSGITGAAPIWNEIMTFILKNRPDEFMRRPETVIEVPCYFGRLEYFIRGTEPKTGTCGSLPSSTPSPTPAH